MTEKQVKIVDKTCNFITLKNENVEYELIEKKCG